MSSGFERTKAILDWVTPSLSPTEKLILVLFASHTNGDPTAYPSLGSIADRVGISRRNVRTLMRRLENKGHLLRKNQVSSHGTSIYEVSFPSLQVEDASIPPLGCQHPRMSATPPGCQHPMGEDASIRGGRMSASSEQTIQQTKEQEHPPIPPSRGECTLSDLRGEWKRFTEIVRECEHAIATLPRKWGPTQNRQLRKLDEFLDHDWGPLHRIAPSLWARGASGRADFSLPRLVSNDCTRAQEVLDGQWSDPDRVSKEPSESEKENLRWQEENRLWKWEQWRKEDEENRDPEKERQERENRLRIQRELDKIREDCS